MPAILKVADGPHLTRVKPAAGLEEGFEFRAAGARRHVTVIRGIARLPEVNHRAGTRKRS